MVQWCRLLVERFYESVEEGLIPGVIVNVDISLCGPYLLGLIYPHPTSIHFRQVRELQQY